MSNFNGTIDARSIQHGSSFVGTIASKLFNVRNKVIHKGVFIKNASILPDKTKSKEGERPEDWNAIWVGDAKVNTSNGYELGPREEIFIQLENPSKVFVVSDKENIPYTWFAY